MTCLRKIRVPAATVLSVCALSAAALLAMPRPGMAAGADGSALFEAQCSQCHGPRDIAYWARTRPDAEARAEWLDGFLTRHYPPAESERAAIIRYIQEAIAEQAGAR